VEHLKGTSSLRGSSMPQEPGPEVSEPGPSTRIFNQLRERERERERERDRETERERERERERQRERERERERELRLMAWQLEGTHQRRTE
jgi:hypothetical protein